MTAQTRKTETPDKRKGVYVYGILPGDVEVEPGTTGVGDPPGEVRVVRHRDLAALVSDIDPDRPLGHPDDLFAHEELLDSSALDVPVLPLRFGAVVSDDSAVADELIGPHYEEFTTAIEQLEGHAEYIVRGRYAEEAILREVLSEDPRAAELARQIRNADPDATRDLRMQLGELLTNAVGERRTADTRAVGDAVADYVAASTVRQPGHDLDAVHVAFLVPADSAADLEQAVDRLAGEWGGRVDLRLFGPLAAYDFVGGAAADPNPGG
jgi:hypothetical protein